MDTIWPRLRLLQHGRKTARLQSLVDASRLVTKRLQIGVVAYGYQQISSDRDAGDRLGCFKSSVYGVGPLIGYIVPIDEQSRRRRRA